MPGPRYFGPFETPRSADGRFAEKGRLGTGGRCRAASRMQMPLRVPRRFSARCTTTVQGFSTREVFIDVDVLRALLPSGQFIHTSAPGSEQRVSTALILDDLEVQESSSQGS